MGWLLPVALAGGERLDEALTAGCAAAGSIAATWLWVVVVLTVVEAGRPQAGAVIRGAVPVRGLCGPAHLRRAVLWACGVTTVASLTVPPAHADGRRDVPTVGSVVAAALRGDGRAAAPPLRPQTVTVRPGDCLWEIAERDLVTRYDHPARPDDRPEIDDVEIDRRWRAIYAANRDLVGDDPDLIRPAQRLRLPR